MRKQEGTILEKDPSTLSAEDIQGLVLEVLRPSNPHGEFSVGTVYKAYGDDSRLVVKIYYTRSQVLLMEIEPACGDSKRPKADIFYPGRKVLPQPLLQLVEGLTGESSDVQKPTGTDEGITHSLRAALSRWFSQLLQR